VSVAERTISFGPNRHMGESASRRTQLPPEEVGTVTQRWSVRETRETGNERSIAGRPRESSPRTTRHGFRGRSGALCRSGSPKGP
jgi:hypothetical protein